MLTAITIINPLANISTNKTLNPFPHHILERGGGKLNAPPFFVSFPPHQSCFLEQLA